MLRLYDYECLRCGTVTEKLVDPDESFFYPCDHCKTGVAKRIISAPGVHLGNQDVAWVRESAAALIDRETALKSKDPLERKLATNPDRASVAEYMKRHGLRHFENERGAPPVYKKPPEIDVKALTDATYRRFRDSQRIEVR